jgi:hypothetical protein
LAANAPPPSEVKQPERRDARNLIDLQRSPFLSHYRKELSRTGLSPSASFPHKVGAFLSNHIFAWAFSYLRFIFRPKHKFQDYKESTGEKGVYAMQAESGADGLATSKPIRVSIAGDWGTGTLEAHDIAEHMKAVNPHYTIHLGDIYYVGDPEEVNENCLGKAGPYEPIRPVTWPHGSMGSFAMNGNHEMYANGNAYFDMFLPTLGIPGSEEGKQFGQKASFFCLQNKFWRIIALDTGYNSLGFPILEHIPGIRKIPGIGPTCRLPGQMIEWLRDQVKPEGDNRGIVLLTHHQYFSAFEEGYPLPARQLAEFIKRPVLWFWGHEHRLAIYDKFATGGGIQAYGRCLGNGGFPVDQGVRIQHREPPLFLYDDRLYKTEDGTNLGFNGFANLTFEENTLSIDFRDVKDHTLLEEKWQVVGGNLSLVSREKIDSGLTVVSPNPNNSSV